MQVSTGKIDITPATGHPMAGYGVDAPRLSTGVNEPLCARCTILWDEGVPHAIVTVDVLGFRHAAHDSIRTRVGALGIATDAFALTATHTHNGPVLSEGLDAYIAYDIVDLTSVMQYTDHLLDAIVQLVADTMVAPRADCTLDYFVLDEDFSFNREGLPGDERDVPTLVARALDGSPLVVLFGYAAHPVAGGLQYLFDPDYPAQAIKQIEAAYDGVFAQFLLGPAGDQNPKDQPGFEGSDAYGADLGDTIVNAIDVPGRPVSGPLECHYTEVSLPLDITLSPANFVGVRADFAARALNTLLPGYERRHALRMVSLIDTTPLAALETTIALPVQRWRFAGDPDFTIVFCGGEVVSGIAHQATSPNGGTENVWFLGYSNEIPAYIPGDDLLNHPCYAGGVDQDYPGIGGGSMTVYDHLAHFRPTRPVTGDGAERVLLNHIATLV